MLFKCTGKRYKNPGETTARTESHKEDLGTNIHLCTKPESKWTSLCSARPVEAEHKSPYSGSEKWTRCSPVEYLRASHNLCLFFFSFVLIQISKMGLGIPPSPISKGSCLNELHSFKWNCHMTHGWYKWKTAESCVSSMSAWEFQSLESRIVRWLSDLFMYPPSSPTPCDQILRLWRDGCPVRCHLFCDYTNI